MTFAETRLYDEATKKARIPKATEFRIVRSHYPDYKWMYRLEERRSFWFFGRRYYWQNFEGDEVIHLFKNVPKAWRELNIVEEIVEIR